MLLSIASPAGPEKYGKLKFSDMTPYLDFYNLMAFDYVGNWSSVSGHHANLYPSTKFPSATPFSTDAAIRGYIKANVPSDKINLGMPLYGRDFQHTSGMGQDFSGVGKGSWDPGVWDYKALPQPGAVLDYDATAHASYTWDQTKGIIVSYDTLSVSKTKIQYIKDERLGGALFWELDGDRFGNRSLVASVSKTFSVE